MTTQKWLLRIAKLGLITLLVANTGCFTMMKRAVTEVSPTNELYDQIRSECGMEEVLKRERSVHQYAQQKTDSVKALVERGHVYTIRDYFTDYKDIQKYSESLAPWSTGGFCMYCGLQDQMRISGASNTQEETDQARCEIIGDCRTAETTPINWSPLLTWLSDQYVFGLLPAFLLCLILGFQGRIVFRLKRSPISALVYLVLWPVNFFMLVRRTLSNIDREARMRMRKESLFLRLSQVEEEILRRALTGLSSEEEEKELREAKVARFQLRYVVALFAVVLLRVAPSAAVVASETEDDPPDRIECHMSLQDESHEDDTGLSTYIWLCEAESKVLSVCENIRWPRLHMQRLIGFGRNVEHVPLVGTIFSFVLNLKPKTT